MPGILSSSCRVVFPALRPQELETANGHAAEPAAPTQQCCVLVGHLMVDMWLRAGPDTSFTLAAWLLRRCVSILAHIMPCSKARSLRIAMLLTWCALSEQAACLRRLLDSDRPEVQIRAFDILYSTSVHSDMLLHAAQPHAKVPGSHHVSFMLGCVLYTSWDSTDDVLLHISHVNVW